MITSEQVLEEIRELKRDESRLSSWAREIEKDFENGKKVNKIKYNKIKELELKYRQKAIDKLEMLNKNSSRVQYCMPPALPPTKKQ